MGRVRLLLRRRTAERETECGECRWRGVAWSGGGVASEVGRGRVARPTKSASRRSRSHGFRCQTAVPVQCRAAPPLPRWLAMPCGEFNIVAEAIRRAHAKCSKRGTWNAQASRTTISSISRWAHARQRGAGRARAQCTCRRCSSSGIAPQFHPELLQCRCGTTTNMSAGTG